MRLLWPRTPLALKPPVQTNRATSVLHGARKSTTDREAMFASDRERCGREPKPHGRRDQIAPARARRAESRLVFDWIDLARGRDCQRDWVDERSQVPCDRPFATVRGVASR